MTATVCCDFCLAPDPRPGWVFPCADFAMIPVPQPGEAVAKLEDVPAYKGAWLACTDCRVLADKLTSDRAAVAKLIERGLVGNRELLECEDAGVREVLEAAFRHFQAALLIGFTAARTGPSRLAGAADRTQAGIDRAACEFEAGL